MRTTVTLDPDTEQVIRERMAAKGVSFKQALNDAIRDGAPGRVDYVFRSPTAKATLLVDVTKANALAGALEDEAQLDRMRAGT
ncbi:MAG: antitoxin [Micrococcales bacterium]|nr:antitoxin [Micrococcales bacterium]